MERYESYPPGQPAEKKKSATGKRYSKPLTAKEIAALRDEDIDYSDIPPLDEEFWNNAVVVKPENKQRITIRLDAEVIAFFQAQGRGYQTRMNSVLRSYMNTLKKSGHEPHNPDNKK